jgi:hypothetical protein
MVVYDCEIRRYEAGSIQPGFRLMFTTTLTSRGGGARKNILLAIPPIGS